MNNTHLKMLWIYSQKVRMSRRSSKGCKMSISLQIRVTSRWENSWPRSQSDSSIRNKALSSHKSQKKDSNKQNDCGWTKPIDRISWRYSHRSRTSSELRSMVKLGMIKRCQLQIFKRSGSTISSQVTTPAVILARTCALSNYPKSTPLSIFSS